MEDAVAQVADFLPPCREMGHIALVLRRMDESRLAQMVSQAGSHVRAGEEADPKAECEFSHDAPGRRWAF